MNNYEAKKQGKIERLERAARLCLSAANAADRSASSMASVIPFGQPILVGHHSEGRDRNYRAKIQRRFEKAHELRGKAKQYERRAAAMRSNRTISSDDPDAPNKLVEKIEKLEKLQKTMRAFNAALRKNDIAEMRRLGFTDEQIDKLKQPDFFGRLGFPDYQLTNNGANIRRLRKRMDDMNRQAAAPLYCETINNIRVEENAEINRVQMFFPGKPSEEIIGKLKSRGFRWSPTNKSWQRQRSNVAIYWAKEVAKM